MLYPLPAGVTPVNMSLALSSPLNVPLNVYKLIVTITGPTTFPTKCPASNFQFNGNTFAGSPPQVTIDYSSPTASSHWVPISAASGGHNGSGTYPATLALVDSHTDQTSCHSLHLGLSFSASAYYTIPTSIVLASAPAPSSPGQSVTFTATVSPTVTPTLASHTPAGNVTFYKCTGSPCTPTSNSLPMATYPVNSSGAATYTTSFSSIGSTAFISRFTPTDPTNFVASTSNPVTQVVGAACAPAPTTGATTTITGTYTGNYEVKTGKSLWLNGGTIKGNLTVDSGAQFAATGGNVTGTITSAGTNASLQGTAVGGNVQSSAGALALGPGTSVAGNVQPGGGGPFCSDGTSLSQSPVKVGGNLTVQSLKVTTPPSSICATKVTTNLQWQSNASPVLIGVCAPNTIGGNLLVQTNSGQVTIGASGAGNTVAGNITVQTNTGGGSISYNSAGGSCQLQGDNPKITGSPTNTTKKSPNTCTTSG